MIQHFYNIHQGETGLIVGSGPNLHDTPPAWFDYPSIGMNTIHLYNGWKPTYYTGVDYPLVERFGKEIALQLADVPKFVPDRLNWYGPNFHRWHKRSGKLLTEGYDPADRDAPIYPGWVYFNVTHAAMQIMLYMGFTTILMIGVQHKPGGQRDHFWGTDSEVAEPDKHNLDLWMQGYRELSALGNFINISENTYVPADVLPRGDWRQWTTEGVKHNGN